MLLDSKDPYIKSIFFAQNQLSVGFQNTSF